MGPGPRVGQLLARVRAGVEALFPHDRVGDVEPLASGFEADVFGFTVERGDGPTELVLRLCHGADAAATTAREFAVMRRLHAVGFPVPEAHLQGADLDGTGRPFLVMERVRGSGLGSRYWGLTESEQAGARRVLYPLMARLHALPTEAVLPHSSRASVPGEVGELEELYAALDEPTRSAFAGALAWLRRRAAEVAPLPPAVIHGDFHYNNVLVRESGEPVVIDWSNCRLADPRLDVTWLGLVTAGDRDYSAYGDPVAGPPADMDVFEAIGAARMILVALSTMAGGSGAGRLRPGIEERLRSGADHTHFVVGRLGHITGLDLRRLDDELRRLLAPA